MIVNSEYVYDNIKLKETRNILQNILGEHEQGYGFDLYRVVKVKCVDEFYDKMKNDSKIFIIDRYNIIGELNKIMQKSRGEIKLIEKIQVKITIVGRIYKNIMDMYFKSGCIPVLWKKLYGRDINKRHCLYNKHVNRNEKHYCHFNKG